jgi:Uma2 family endonuclease
VPHAFDPDDDAAIGAVVRDNPDWRIEVSAEGSILVSPLTGTECSGRELEAAMQLAQYARHAGGKAFGPTAGFRLPDNSVLGPDGSWLSDDHIASLSDEEKERSFWRCCPDVVVEVMSDWDLWSSLQRKVDRYIANGALYAVAINPESRDVYERGTPPAGLKIDFERIFDV